MYAMDFLRFYRGVIRAWRRAWRATARHVISPTVIMCQRQQQRRHNDAHFQRLTHSRHATTRVCDYIGNCGVTCLRTLGRIQLAQCQISMRFGKTSDMLFFERFGSIQTRFLIAATTIRAIFSGSDNQGLWISETQGKR